MSGAVFLSGDRVDLRTIEKSDLDFLQEAINDPSVRQHLTIRWPINRDQEEEWFEEQVTSDERINLLIVGPDGPAGTVGLGPVDDPNGTAEIGIWLREREWGQGYGTEASRLLISHAFDRLRIHRIEARVFEGNDASQELWETLDFEHEAVHRDAAYLHGEYRDVHRYAVLETEWET
ncbi:GNAT family N-acetyltransferase [Halodesulfurarchaeum sp.]|uniref:GNAT family N-acetyltransferase n=1 Tax=Halodesulfurarchaeum sp. TaxID=1980530 RepID=UPI001BBD681A|nr:GNAT family N-acetyltransferase [Halodesulfurarchaeum sp.]